MALAEAILVCLTERSMSGYDLGKTFDASIGFFWRASHQQIYRELSRLRDRGLVKSEEVSQSGKPNRIVHTLTPEGRKYLKNWSAKASRKPSLKDDLMVKLYALEHMDIAALKEQFGNRMEQHLERANIYQKIKKKHYSGKDLSVTGEGKLIALDMGIANEQQQAEWCEQILNRLDKLEEKNA